MVQKLSEIVLILLLKSTAVRVVGGLSLNVDGLKDEDFEDLKILDPNVITNQAVDFNSVTKAKKMAGKDVKVS